MTNPYYDEWALRAGIIHEPLNQQPAEVSTPNSILDSKITYQVVGGAAAATTMYFLLSAADGPLPVGDYLGMMVAPRMFLAGAKVGGVVYDITH